MPKKAFSNTPKADLPLKPSEFMREYRPEYYSDTADRTTIQLDRPTLEYHLDTITARNQTHDFETFCRKLCQRTICPRLVPASGPEGGGDSKVDTESIPASEEIASLTYLGEANQGTEHWAFAFSAKKTWAQKVRGDVAGIIATRRGYQRIYCVTSRFARARDRARVEDELTKKHGVPVKILDRAWIVEEVVDKERKDIALHYLGVGREVESARLGPSDYSRKQQLEDLETALDDPESHEGIKSQLATDALIAAKLSRGLERTRAETDGRFARAIRLADAGGVFRQRLTARYEHLWTSFWWFDDVALLNDSYESFEALAVQSDLAANIECLCNLMQAIFNSVIHKHLTAEAARLDARAARLRVLLVEMAGEPNRPNNALSARVSLHILDLNLALRVGDAQTVSSLWPKFSEVLREARGLGEFDAESLIKMVQVFGTFAAKDPGYTQLVDQLAEFVSARTSEGEGALVLLRRAQQLELDQNFEIIRLLGRAAIGLTKKEYTPHRIEAMQRLAVAYHSAGLLWAACSSITSALASTFIEADDDSHVPAHVIGSLVIWCHIVLELGHVPEFLEAMRLLRGCVAGMPLDEASEKRATDQRRQLDGDFASRIVALPDATLERIVGLPDVLKGLDMPVTYTALLYALGYEKQLRAEGTIPPEDNPEHLLQIFSKLAAHGAQAYPRPDLVFNHGAKEVIVANVIGMRVEICHSGSEAAAAVAEAVAGTIECVFTTVLQHDVHPHTERFCIKIQESEVVNEPRVDVTPTAHTVTVIWPAGRPPSCYPDRRHAHYTLVEIAAWTLGITCIVDDPTEILKKLMDDDVVLDRVTMVMFAGNSRHRLMGHTVAQLARWLAMGKTSYPICSPRPVLDPRVPAASPKPSRSPVQTAEKKPNFRAMDHRSVEVRSIIDVHLWTQAGWKGVAYAHGAGSLPLIALMFNDGEAGKQIFERWRTRFGSEDKKEEIYFAIIRAIDAQHPHHYKALITSNWSGAALDEQRIFSLAAKFMTMPASSSKSFHEGLAAFRRAGAYVLVPATLQGGVPTLHPECGILKRRWVIKNAAEVSPGDPEAVALRLHRDG